VQSDDVPSPAIAPVMLLGAIAGFLLVCCIVVVIAAVIVDIADLWCDIPFISRRFFACP
jgi:hypothetical protein